MLPVGTGNRLAKCSWLGDMNLCKNLYSSSRGALWRKQAGTAEKQMPLAHTELEGKASSCNLCVHLRRTEEKEAEGKRARKKQTNKTKPQIKTPHANKAGIEAHHRAGDEAVPAAPCPRGGAVAPAGRAGRGPWAGPSRAGGGPRGAVAAPTPL